MKKLLCLLILIIISSNRNIICNNDSTILTVEPELNYSSYLWSTGDTTKLITIIEAGKYYVTITNSNGCVGIDSIEIIVNEPPTPTISGDTVLCQNSIGKLIVDQDYISYEWNTGDTTKEISIDKAGEYYVTVIDSNGCSGVSNIINVELLTIDLSINPNVINFEDTDIYSTTSKSFTINNLSNYRIEISSIYIANYTDIYTINNYNTIISSGETDTIVINFSPTQTIQYQDSIIINIENPCNAAYSILINGLGKEEKIMPKISIWMPDTTGEIGDNNYTIPIYAKIITEENKIMNLEYNAIIGFDAEMYFPKIYNIAEKTNETVDYSNDDYYEKQLELNCSDITITAEPTIIGQMTGDILVGVNKETPLKIKEFSFSGDSIEIETIDGSLSTTICGRDIMRIRTFQPTELSIVQTSIETSAKILSEETGIFTLKIYDIRGVEIESFNWNANDKQDIAIKLKSELYSQGVYNAILLSPENAKSKAFAVVR